MTLSYEYPSSVEPQEEDKPSSIPDPIPEFQPNHDTLEARRTFEYRKREKNQEWLHHFHKLGRQALAGLTLLFINQHESTGPLRVEEPSADKLSFSIGGAVLTLTEFDRFTSSANPSQPPIEVQNKNLRTFLEADRASYDLRRASPVHNPSQFNAWVEQQLISERDFLEGHGIDMDNPEALSPKEFAKIAVLIVDNSFEYDETTNSILELRDEIQEDQEKMGASAADQNPAETAVSTAIERAAQAPSRHLYNTTDLKSVDTLLEENSKYVVCRHFAEGTKQVFAVLKSKFPKQLGNTYMQTIVGRDNNHAWDALIQVTSPQTAELCYIDPTALDGGGELDEVIAGDKENFWSGGREDQKLRYYFNLLFEEARWNLDSDVYPETLKTKIRNSYVLANSLTIQEEVAFLEEGYGEQHNLNRPAWIKVLQNFTSQPLAAQLEAMDEYVKSHQLIGMGSKERLITLYERIYDSVKAESSLAYKFPDRNKMAMQSLRALLNLADDPAQKALYLEELQQLEN